MAPSDRLRDLARRHGATDEAIDAAPDDLALLGQLLDARVRPGALDLTIDEVAQRAEVAPDEVHRLWRALGFADPAAGDTVATAEDAAVLGVAYEQVDTANGIERLVRQTRVVSAAVARIAGLWADDLREALDTGADVADVAERLLATFDPERLAFLIGYVHRHQTQTAFRQELTARRAAPDGAVPRVVGFADLVDFTVRTRDLSGRDIAALVERFEALAFDTVARHGARLVKTIGDEAMFVGEDVHATVELARSLARRDGDPGVPPLRVGLDLGPVLLFEGDVFGTPVNRAARLVAQAEPATVVTSAAVRDAHRDGPGWASLGVRTLKGLGQAEVFRAG